MDVIINACCDKELPLSVPIEKSDSIAEQLLYCLGYTQQTMPLAAVLAKTRQLTGAWAVITPCHWEASHNNVMLTAYGKQLHASKPQWQDCFDRLIHHWSESIEFYCYDEETWLLSSPRLSALQAQPVAQLIGLPLMPALANLDSTLFWQKFFTESQMFFATHPNDNPINGIWVWGQGELMANDHRIICADNYFLPLAQACSASAIELHSQLDLSTVEILLLPHLDVLSEKQQKQIHQKARRWYWRDHAYTCKKASWFTHLWRALIHAH